MLGLISTPDPRYGGAPDPDEEREREVGLADRPDREPAKAAELRQRDVLAELEAELLGVPGEGLVRVVDPEADVGEAERHGGFPSGGSIGRPRR